MSSIVENNFNFSEEYEHKKFNKRRREELTSGASSIDTELPESRRRRHNAWRSKLNEHRNGEAVSMMPKTYSEILVKEVTKLCAEHAVVPQAELPVQIEEATVERKSEDAAMMETTKIAAQPEAVEAKKAIKEEGNVSLISLRNMASRRSQRILKQGERSRSIDYKKMLRN